MKVYMEGEWHEGIDYLQIELPLPSAREMVADWDPEGRGVMLTLTDGLVFRKFGRITIPKYVCDRCQWEGDFPKWEPFGDSRFVDYGLCPHCNKGFVRMTGE